MLLTTHQNTDEMSILFNSSFGVNVQIKFCDKSIKTYNNIDIIHWLDSPTDTSLTSSIHKFYLEIPNDTFYWLSFEVAKEIKPNQPSLIVDKP